LTPRLTNPPRLLSQAGFVALVAGAERLVRDRSGDKVLRLADRRILKLFRIKRLVSFSLLWPPALRFRRNGRRLARLGIVAPQVERVFFCPATRRYGVIYPEIVGTSLAQALRERPEDDPTWQRAVAFIAELHAKGVYFRSLHPDNLLLLPDGGCGLIDVADLRLCRRPLSLSQRARNLGHLMRREEHLRLAEDIGLPRLLGHYIEASGLDPLQGVRLRVLLAGKMGMDRLATDGSAQ
jgi:hypothetical protein